MKFVLGLTGGIGGGKSAASQWFESQGIAVVDADIVAREVVDIGQPALQQIQQAFGDWVLLEDGSLNRRALREHIFHSQKHEKRWKISPTLLFALQLFNSCMQHKVLMRF